MALIILTLGWLYGLGAITQRHVRASPQVTASYQEVVHRWDLMRVPADQPLFLMAFTGAGVVLVFMFWGFLPVTTPHPHEDYEYLDSGEEKPVKPAKAITRMENVLTRATSALEDLEKTEGKGGKAVKAKQEAGSGKGGDEPTDGKAKGKKVTMSMDSHSQEQEHSQGDRQH